MVGLNAPSISLNANNAGYNADDFGFAQEYVESSRKAIFLDESDGLFLYNRAKRNDRSGQENGAYYFSRISNSELYGDMVTHIEENLILQNIVTLKKYIRKKTHQVEYGPGVGLGNKIKNLFHKLILSKEKKHYIHTAVDSSGAALDQCENEYRSDLGLNISFEGIKADWRMASLVQHIQDKVYYLLGGSIGNYDDETVVRILEGMTSDSVNRGCDVILSHFVAPTGNDRIAKIQIIKNQYSAVENKEFVFKGFEALGIDSNKLEFAVDYEEGKEGDPDAIKVGAKLLEPVTLEVGGGQTLMKNAGEYIRAIRSRRYKQGQFDELAGKAGCEIKESFEDRECNMRLAVYRTKPKTRPKYHWYLAGTVLGLLMLFAANKLGSYQERQESERAQQQRLYDLFLGKNLRGNEHEGERIVYGLEHRYGLTMTESERQALLLSYYDRIFINKKYRFECIWGRGDNAYFDSRLYCPSIMAKFVGDHPFSLGGGGSITPNKELTHYTQALQNSYYYKGPKLDFREPDKSLPDYQCEQVGESSKSGFDIRAIHCGIKVIDGKEYFVVQMRKDGPYVLEPRGHGLSYAVLDASVVVTDIIQKGEVPLLASTLCQFLNTEYGSGPTEAINGQEVIAEYLTDLYAQGYSLNYLLGGDVKGSYKDPVVMKAFCLGVLLPHIQDKLKEGPERMFDLDRKKIAEESTEFAGFQTVFSNTESYLMTYIPESQYLISPGVLRSCILKQLLLDEAGNSLNTQRDMRCRLTEKREVFLKEAGISIPSFPLWLICTDVDGNTKINIDMGDNDMQVDNGVTLPLPTYVALNGSRYNLELKANPNGSGNTLLAQKCNTEEQRIIWDGFKAGKFGALQIDHLDPRLPSQKIEDYRLVINRLTKDYPYKKEYLDEVLADYDDWKAAMQEYEKKRGK